MATNPFVLQALAHGLKAIAYATFGDSDNPKPRRPRARPHSLSRHGRQGARVSGGDGDCGCTGRASSVPPLWGGSDD